MGRCTMVTYYFHLQNSVENVNEYQSYWNNLIARYYSPRFNAICSPTSTKVIKVPRGFHKSIVFNVGVKIEIDGRY